MKTRVCELCEDEASVHCASDSAFLCFHCDAKVHGANFLVARHIRRPICSGCRSVTDDVFSGAGAGRGNRICRNCSGGGGGCDTDSSSSSSACISSTGSIATAPGKIRARDDGKIERFSSSSSVTEMTPGRFSGEVDSAARSERREREIRPTARRRPVPRVDSKAEGVLVTWLRRLGLSDSEAVERASRALGFCSGELTILPLRVLLAAAAWLGLRTSEDRRMSTQQMLRRLEEVSGVPARLILAAEAKIARARHSADADGSHNVEEGWAESSP